MARSAIAAGKRLVTAGALEFGPAQLTRVVVAEGSGEPERRGRWLCWADDVPAVLALDRRVRSHRDSLISDSISRKGPPHQAARQKLRRTAWAWHQ